jgi:glutamate dehydrogenase (NAD(P)+)
VGGVVHQHNADRVEARLIVEGANQPLTGAADEILGDRGVTVVPDLLANAGGVIASHLESVQDANGSALRAAETYGGVERRLRTAFTAVCECAGVHDLSLRKAALGLALGRVAAAHRARGLYP